MWRITERKRYRKRCGELLRERDKDRDVESY